MGALGPRREAPIIMAAAKFEIGCISCNTVIMYGHTIDDRMMQTARDIHLPDCKALKEKA